MSELRKKIEEILINNIDTPKRSKKDSEFILSTLKPKLLDELGDLIKQERIRYGEWLIGEDEILPGDPDVLLNKGAVNNLYVRNYFRMKLRQRNKGEIDKDKDRDRF